MDTKNLTCFNKLVLYGTNIEKAKFNNNCKKYKDDFHRSIGVSANGDF